MLKKELQELLDELILKVLHEIISHPGFQSELEGVATKRAIDYNNSFNRNLRRIMRLLSGHHYYTQKLLKEKHPEALDLFEFLLSRYDENAVP